MSGSGKIRLAPPVEPVPSRVLTCTRCRELIEVIEIPFPYLDPVVYVCGQCGTVKTLEEESRER